MKKFTTGEIRDLFNRVMIDEISFSRMVEVINERVEEPSKPKFKKGDKVMLKDGCNREWIYKYLNTMGEWIGKPITIKSSLGILGGYEFTDCPYYFSEDWLEPYVEELKEGDIAIFWDEEKELAIIRFYGRYSIEGHYDNREWRWKNAIKFESKEQYERLIKGEI